MVPQLGAWLQAKRSAVAVNEVKEPPTTTNGSSNVKDALNRIGQTQGVHGQALVDLSARLAHVEELHPELHKDA